MQTDSPGEGTLSITDYSPEWAYPEGGAKVLVAGPWTETSDQYTILFDNFPVPSILVQNGLLRCYCPGKYILTSTSDLVIRIVFSNQIMTGHIHDCLNTLDNLRY